MKLGSCIYIVLLSRFCQAALNMTETDTDDPERKEENTSRPYLHRSTKCSFALKMPSNSSSDAVALTGGSAASLPGEICSELRCGGVFHLQAGGPSPTCLGRCVYQDGLLRNCSPVNHSRANNCTSISGVVCGHQALRLVGGPDRCAGRVELWRDGRWGTVCDDHWDLRDGDVACAQSGCGYALSVSGQGGSFPPGRGPIYLDDLNCTGREDNLWSCPAGEDESDCGHKEDAGVTCSEMKAVRLTGGLDRCSGRVEIHRNGSWGTVCDNCWNGKMASMVCSMLQCGAEAKKFSQFVPPLSHNNGAQWYYMCYGNERNLWGCKEIGNKPHLCKDSRASGVICNGSLGFPTATIRNSTVMTTISSEGPTTSTPAENTTILSMLLSTWFLCTVGFLLLVVLIICTVTCCHYRRKYEVILQQNRNNRPGPSDCSYQDTIVFTKATNNSPQTEVFNQESAWTELNGIYNPSVDTGYEQHEPKHYKDPSAPLSTFRNSKKYSTAATYSERDFGDGPSNTPKVMGPIPCSNDEDINYARVSAVSADSFDSSCTSSGESYENTNSCDLVTSDIPQPGPSQSSVTDYLRANSTDQLQNLGDEGYSLINSPVGLEGSFQSDDDYDDVGS